MYYVSRNRKTKHLLHVTCYVLRDQKGFARLKAIFLATIILLGLLTVWLAFSSAQVSANNQRRLADLQQIQIALNIFFKANGFYPYGQGSPNGFEQYLNHWPMPPSPTGGCPETSNAYYYSPQSSGDDYSVTFCLGAKTQGFAAGTHTLTSKGIQ